MVIDSTIIHGVPLGANNYRILVKKALNPEACLPILVGDKIVLVKDAIDTMVPWPKHLVFSSTVPKVKIILLQYHNC